MTSRIDVIGANGNDGLHYQDSDLTWLARNVHEWPKKEQGRFVSASKYYGQYGEGIVDCKSGATKQQWLDERARLQNKPSWDDVLERHPWANYIAQSPNGGHWECFELKPVSLKNSHWASADGAKACVEYYKYKGQVLGDWRNTLEKRPEQLSNIAEHHCDECPHPIAELEHDPSDYQPIDMGTKHDNEKPRMDLIPPTAERLLAEVLSYGAEKYAPDNWRKVPDAKTRYIAAAMRHINAHRSGELIDSESGLPHLAHAMCSLAFILELDYE